MSASPVSIPGRLLGGGEPVELRLVAGRIAAIHPLRGTIGTDLPWLGAGLTDLQVNGYAGLDFNAPVLAG